MSDQQPTSPTPDEEPEKVIDMEAEWGPYLTQEERDAADAQTWDLSQIRVWPAGEDGPSMPLTELAAWRAEERRMREALEQFEQDDDRETEEKL